MSKVDELVKQQFLSEKARKETNLQFVCKRVLSHPQRRQLLALYRGVYEGRKIREDERSLVQNRLKLIGLVRAEDGYLHIRNEIYRHVFDLAWIRQNTPTNWGPLILLGIGISVGIGAILWGFLPPIIHPSGTITPSSYALAATDTPSSPATPRLTETAILTTTGTPTPPATLIPSETPTLMAIGTPASLDCQPIGGVVEPFMCVAGVSVQINDGRPRPVGYEEQMALKAGDTLRLVSLRYCASSEALADAVAGEAYLFKNRVEDYNGLFTRRGAHIRAGCGDIGDFEGSWTMEPGQHRVVIALVHYFGANIGIDLEVDDRFYLNLDVQP